MKDYTLTVSRKDMNELLLSGLIYLDFEETLLVQSKESIENEVRNASIFNEDHPMKNKILVHPFYFIHLEQNKEYRATPVKVLVV